MGAFSLIVVINLLNRPIMASILPDEPIPQTLNDDLQSLISDFNQLDTEEQKLSTLVAENAAADNYYSSLHNGKEGTETLDKSSESLSSDSEYDPEKARAKRLKGLIENMNEEREKIKLQNRLFYVDCYLLTNLSKK